MLGVDIVTWLENSVGGSGGGESSGQTPSQETPWATAAGGPGRAGRAGGGMSVGGRLGQEEDVVAPTGPAAA